MKPNDELEKFAGGVHGALSFGHCLAALWNWRRRNYAQAIFHIGTALFEAYASRQHKEKR